jgi:hypothetical protein
VVQVTHRRQPALERQRLETLGEDRASHVVDDEVHALAVGRLHDRVAKVAGPRAKADVEAELPEAGELLGGARRADDPRAQRLGRLERSHADPRRDGGDEQPLPGRQMALRDQHVVHDDERERRRGRLVPRERIGHREGFARVHQRELGEAAAAAAHHARAHRHAGDAVAHLDHLARALAPARLGRGAVSAAQELTAVERRGAHAHEDLARLRLGRGGLAKLDSGSRRAGADPARFHRAPRTQPNALAGERRPASVESSCLLECVGDLEHAPLVLVTSDDL